MDDKSIFVEVSKVLLDRFVLQMNNERPEGECTRPLESLTL